MVVAVVVAVVAVAVVAVTVAVVAVFLTVAYCVTGLIKSSVLSSTLSFVMLLLAMGGKSSSCFACAMVCQDGKPTQQGPGGSQPQLDLGPDTYDNNDDDNDASHHPKTNPTNSPNRSQRLA